MKLNLTWLVLVATCFAGYSQTDYNTKGMKGKMFIYWGWNWSAYTNSDINFSGDGYDFTLSDVEARDRQTEFEANVYFNPGTITIPQYNFRIGYFFKENYSLSFGSDHMKYVMNQNQTVKINGKIDEPLNPYDGVYDNDDIQLTEDFLTFEHTDGLNYLNLELRRYDEIYRIGKVSLNVTEGIGAGVLVPKTNTKLMGHERHDKFHLSGFGLGAVVGINFTFYDIFFIQSEFKGGYINMPDIRTTHEPDGRASQDFFFAQINAVFGATFPIDGRNRKKK